VARQLDATDRLKIIDPGGGKVNDAILPTGDRKKVTSAQEDIQGSSKLVSLWTEMQ